MVNKINKALNSLAEADKVRNELVLERDGVLESRAQLQEKILHQNNLLEEAEMELERKRTVQSEQSNTLKSEELKLVEQRKQLSSMGTKSAKYVEKQIDLASQNLGQLEERAVKAMEEVEVLNVKCKEIKETIESLDAQLKAEEEASSSRLDEIEKEVKKLDKTRNSSFSALDDRFKSLYDRVHVRYPDSVIAKVDKGSCRSCFRSLPKQTYNQILSGSMLLQCPDCNRILVHQPGAGAEAEKAAA